MVQKTDDNETLSEFAPLVGSQFGERVIQIVGDQLVLLLFVDKFVCGWWKEGEEELDEKRKCQFKEEDRRAEMTGFGRGC